jgi:mannose-1-phosphate guanylyltransferase/phosphomannomutase
VIILAAGISSRTQEIAKNVPKPMLPLDGRPVMECVIEFLRTSGFNKMIVTTHYQAKQIVEYFGDGARLGVKISYSYEPQLLNTAGSLRFIYDRLEPEFLVCGSHFYLPRLDLNAMVEFHRSKHGVGTIAFCTIENHLAQYFGQAILNDAQRLVRFQEKPCVDFNVLVHTTYQIYRREVITMVPQGESLSIPDYLVPKLLEHGLPVYGYITQGPLISVSTPLLYERAKRLIGMYSSVSLRRKVEKL